MGDSATGNILPCAVRKGLVYSTRDGETLQGDLYIPAGKGPFPVVVAAPGGGWAVCDPGGMRGWGNFFARQDLAVFAIRYRVSPCEKTFPKPVLDVLDAVRFVRCNATDLNIDPERIALLGSSAGAHVTALAALAGNVPLFAGTESNDNGDARVKVFAGIYGPYDLFAHWQQEIVNAPNAFQRRSECLLGESPYENRQLYFEASPLSYVRHAANKLPIFLAWGTNDDVVEPQKQSISFLNALKQAGFMVQAFPVEGAGHYWFMDDSPEEQGSYSAALAPRLLRFLQRHL